VLGGVYRGTAVPFFTVIIPQRSRYFLVPQLSQLPRFYRTVWNLKRNRTAMLAGGLSTVRPAPLWLFSEFGAVYKYSDLLTYLRYFSSPYATRYALFERLHFSCQL